MQPLEKARAERRAAQPPTLLARGQLAADGQGEPSYFQFVSFSCNMPDSNNAMREAVAVAATEHPPQVENAVVEPVGTPAVDQPVDDVVLRHPPPAPAAAARRSHPTTLAFANAGCAEPMQELDLEQPTLVVQSPKSPKTPTLSRKLKAISLDSEPAKTKAALDVVVRDVFSMPNTPKKHTRPTRDVFDVDDHGSTPATTRVTMTNLKRFASNTSISGSQTLKTLPEIMTLQDFSSENRVEPVRIKAKGLLERRGSNASLTIDLGASTTEKTLAPPTNPVQARLKSAKSISTLNLTSFGTCFTSFYQNVYKCEHCVKRSSSQFATTAAKTTEKPKDAQSCGNCTIYEAVPSKFSHQRDLAAKKKCNCACNMMMCGRKSLSNENLYVPPCSFCVNGTSGKDNTTVSLCGGWGTSRHCRGHRRAYYPRQTDLEESHMLSDDFKLHLQNVQYLQTAGSVLSTSELRGICEVPRVHKLHQEFWEVPLNLQEKCIVSGSQTRNRYKGVLPNEHSRVHLQQDQSYIHANFIKGPDYTETAYIATQGPMAHTCGDFWQMVWQTNCNCIVMLTQLVEKGRNKCELYFPLGSSTKGTVKTAASTTSYCSLIASSIYSMKEKFSYGYTTHTTNNNNCTISTHHHSSSTSTSSLSTTISSSSSSSSVSSIQKTLDEDIKAPSSSHVDQMHHGNFSIKFISIENLGDCRIRKLQIKNLATSESRQITHFWYPNWQDHKVTDAKQILQLAVSILDREVIDNNIDVAVGSNLEGRGQFNSNAKTKSNDKSSTDAKNEEKLPLIVHCSAGIGRTGCFLAILNGIQQLRTNSNVDVLAILCSLRLHRGGMVQTAEQYELIHHVLGLYAERMPH